jgi:hypothetical protein
MELRVKTKETGRFCQSSAAGKPRLATPFYFAAATPGMRAKHRKR